MTMRTGKLGRTGLEVSIVGLGTAFLGIPDANLAAAAYAGSGDPIPAQDDLAVSRSARRPGREGTLNRPGPSVLPDPERELYRASLEGASGAWVRVVRSPPKSGSCFEGVDHTRGAVEIPEAF